jgi:hypothetical protein
MEIGSVMGTREYDSELQNSIKAWEFRDQRNDY